MRRYELMLLLRPDLEAWLGDRASSAPDDRLEFHDPLRVETVALGTGRAPLAANFGVGPLEYGTSFLEEIVVEHS